MIEINTDNKIKTIIVDDEPLARKGLLIRLAEFADVEVIAQCHNGVSALEVIKQEKPRLVFLDIQMPGMTGFDVMKSLHDDMATEDWPIVVFVTAYDQYALKAFEVHALDYLLKPVNDERLQDCITKVRSQINSDSQNENQTKLVNMVKPY
jgi:two-component system LytT family response regulator